MENALKCPKTATSDPNWLKMMLVCHFKPFSIICGWFGAYLSVFDFFDFLVPKNTQKHTKTRKKTQKYGIPVYAM